MRLPGSGETYPPQMTAWTGLSTAICVNRGTSCPRSACAFSRCDCDLLLFATYYMEEAAHFLPHCPANSPELLQATHLFKKSLCHAWPRSGRAHATISARRKIWERRKIEKSPICKTESRLIDADNKRHVVPSWTSHETPRKSARFCFKTLNINVKYETFFLCWVEWLVNSQSPNIIQITWAIWQESRLD